MEKKACFGLLDRVFPVNERGYREVTPECFQCPERVSCLRQALTTKEGIEMKIRILEQAPVRGLMERIRRWSRKKELSRLAQGENNRNHDD
jgi:hypothetical protein